MFKKKYVTNCWCNNCSTHQEVQIPRGVSVAQFVESGTGKCGNCGCNTLVADYNQIDEFKQTTARQYQRRQQRQLLLQQVKVRKPLKRAPLPQERPSNRPVNLSRPSKIYRSDVDFWAGKLQKGDENESY